MRRPLDPYVKEDPSPADFHDERLARLLAYWVSRCSPSELPPVAAIDPLELKFLLGWLMIMEPVEGGADYRYRLYGSYVADAFGRDLTGQRIGQSFPDISRFVISIYQQLLRNRRPILTRHTPPSLIPVDRWERLCLPFVDAEGTITRIVVGTIAHGVKRIEREPPPWPINPGPPEEPG
jgi:hypothetical protein